MSSSPSNRLAAPEGLRLATARLRAQWAGMAVRERRLIALALGLVGLALVWMIAVQPAWRTLRELPAQIDTLDLQLQQMQRLAAESRELRQLPPVPAAQAEAALRGATARLGANASLNLQGDRAILTLNGVEGSALAAWLGEVRSAARARPDEAKLSRGPNGYSGSVTLTLPPRG